MRFTFLVSLTMENKNNKPNIELNIHFDITNFRKIGDKQQVI